MLKVQSMNTLQINKFTRISCEIALRWMPQNTFDDWQVHIGSGNGFVQPGNKPLHEQ